MVYVVTENEDICFVELVVFLSYLKVIGHSVSANKPFCRFNL